MDLKIMIGAFLVIVLGLALMPTTLDMARSARQTHSNGTYTDNPNITSTQAGLVDIVPLLFIITIVVGAVAGILMALRR